MRGSSEKEYTTARRNWSKGISIQAAGYEYVSSRGTVFVLFQPLLSGVEIATGMHNARLQGQDFSTPYHTYAVYIKAGRVLIYDPAYVSEPRTGGGRQRIRGLTLLKDLLAELRSRQTAINEIWINGRADTSRRCNELTRRWIEEEFARDRGTGLSSLDGKGWDRVSV